MQFWDSVGLIFSIHFTKNEMLNRILFKNAIPGLKSYGSYTASLIVIMNPGLRSVYFFMDNLYMSIIC